MVLGMRTTLNIEEDALMYAKERAQLTGKSLGAVVSEALRAVSQPRSSGIALTESGLPYIASRPGAGKVTSDQVRAAIEQEEMEKHAPARR